MNHELRILNGLHRGAALPLDGDSLVIGANDQADIVLVDPGIEEQHATLLRIDSGWSVTAEGGQLHTPDSPDPQGFVDLGPGDFVRVGPVWMMVAEEGQPWVAPPPDPQPGLGEDDAADAPVEAAEEVEPVQAASRDEGGQADKPAGRIKLHRLLIAPLLVVTVLSGAVAYAITSKPPLPAMKKNLDIESDLKTHHLADGAKAGAGQAKLTPKELREAFRKRLSDVDLLDRFHLDLHDGSWLMRANLDDGETTRFERVLTEFMAEYKINFPVDAKIVPAAQMLPFKITQVVSGSHASVITADGNRLYVGDEYRGMRVASIQGDKLLFIGKRRIEVNW